MPKLNPLQTQTMTPSSSAPVITVGQDPAVFSNLAATLAEVRKLKGVHGYILRSNTAAVVDLLPTDALAEYAILSFQISASSRAIAEQFNLADLESVIVEGAAIKVLCMGIGENRLSIFMDKTCGHGWIVKRILL